MTLDSELTLLPIWSFEILEQTDPFDSTLLQFRKR